MRLLFDTNVVLDVLLTRWSQKNPMNRKYTQKQGQYLAFIHYYTKIHGYPPAESDMQRYFKVTPPAVHQMVPTLEKQGLIKKVPGQPRTVSILLPSEEVPDLE